MIPTPVFEGRTPKESEYVAVIMYAQCEYFEREFLPGPDGKCQRIMWHKNEYGVRERVPIELIRKHVATLRVAADRERLKYLEWLTTPSSTPDAPS